MSAISTQSSDAASSGGSWGLLLIPTIVVLGLIFGIPLGGLISTSFREMTGPAQVGDEVTLIHYKDFLTDPFFISLVGQTVKLGLVVVVCCLLIAYPLAYILARTRSKWRGLALFLVISPLLVSAVVRNLGWLPLLSESGLVNWLLLSAGITSRPLALVNNFTGVVIGLVHALLPFMLLTLTTVIQRIDVDLEEAAANLGAGPARVFFRVLLPLSLPGIVAGSLLVFSMAVSAYTTPAILGGNRVLVIATYIAQQFRATLNYPLGATASAVLLAVAIVLAILAMRFRTKEGDAQ